MYTYTNIHFWTRNKNKRTILN